MKAEVYYRIILNKNPYPTKKAIKLYGELCLLEGILTADPNNKEAQGKHAVAVLLAQADIFTTAACGYDKADNINFTPSGLNFSFTDLEVEPCREEDGSVERCEPSEAQFWSVYIRKTDGLASCIADLPTKEMANQFKKIILNAVKHFAGEPV